MNTSLFRPQAIAPEQALSQSDTEARLIRPGRWLLAIGLLVAFVGGLLAASLVQVTSTVAGPAVVVTATSGSRLQATTSGQVIAVPVRNGTPIRRGDIVISIREPSGAVRQLRSLTNGIVRELLVQPGELIRFADFIATVAPPDAELVARIVVPAEEVGAISPGMSARISPLGASPATDGQLIATVTDVIRTPLSRAALEALLVSQPNPTELTAPQSVVLAALGPADQLTWNTSNAPAGVVDPGTIGTAEIVVRQEALLGYLFGTDQ